MNLIHCMRSPLSKVPQWYVKFEGAAGQATVFARRGGINATNTRNSLAWVPVAGVDTQVSATQNRIGTYGLLTELTCQQYVTAPDAPQSETLTLAAGSYYAYMTGAGSVDLALGTATGTGLPFSINATTPRAFTITGAGGTITTTVNGVVSFLNVVNWSVQPSGIHSAMVRATDAAQFTTPAGIGNDYCCGVRTVTPWNGSFANMRGPTAIFAVGVSGNSRATVVISAAALVTATFVDADGGSKTLAWQGASSDLTAAHSIAVSRSAAGVCKLFVDGFSVGKDAGTGTGIASTTPPTTTYLGVSTVGAQGPIWLSDFGFNTPSTRPVFTLDSRSRVACLGDSTTYGAADATAYPAVLGTTLGGGWLSVNEGVVGNTTGQMSTRYTGTRIQDRRYDVLAVLGGINDVRTDVAEATIETNLQAIYDAHRAQGGKLVLLTILPWGGYAQYTAGREAVRSAVNTWIKAYAAANPTDTVLVDTAAYMSDGGSPEHIKAGWYDVGDDLHPNTAGRAALGAYVYAQGRAAGIW